MDRDPQHETAPDAAAEEEPNEDSPRTKAPRLRLRSRLHTAAGAVRRAAAWTVPSHRTRRGAALGAAAAVVAQLAFEGARLYSGFGVVFDVLFFALFGALVVLLGTLAWRLGAALVRTLPRFLGILGAGALVGGLALAASFGSSPATLGLFVVAPVAALAFAGGALAFVSGPGFRGAGRARRAAGFVCLAAGLGGAVALAAWFGAPGSAEHLIEPGPRRSAGAYEPAGADALAGLSDPGQPGPYAVATLTYGSGSDRRRPEFGADADLTTPTVDGTPFLKGFSGWKADLRERYWGFGRKELPLNGRVWYPAADTAGAPRADGPFPLVLVVHGNHNMGDYSDPGYAYLGEHLASRGFILVSVDENFLNGHHVPGPRRENDARGWLLLEHLKVWRSWAADPESPFHGKVDLDRIGLVGHSRGGEAAAHAAAFDRLPAWPDDATIEFDYGFGIRAVVAIAPSDGQYQPADRRTPLQDVAYLTLQGGHDGDVSAWAGDRQLRRVRFTRDDPRLFKAGVYLYRANHGQFNTAWGRFDTSPPRAWLLNVAPLMDPEDQRRAALTLIGGFLEATLHDRPGYREMFRDIDRAADWLPPGIYSARYRDGSFQPLAEFEEDVDVSTGSAPGSAIRAERLAVWREGDVPLRGGSSREDPGVFVGWREADGEAPAVWALSVPEGWSGSRLSLDLARAPEEPKRRGGGDGDDTEEESDDDEEAPEPGATPVDLTIELADRDGDVARLPLGRFGPELRTLPSRFSKLDAIEEDRYGSKPEPVFRTYSMPLAAFAEAAPGFDPTALAEIRLVFDRSPRGVVIVDNVGLAAD